MVRKRKGKEEYLYIATFICYVYLKALRHGSHIFSCKLHHACLSFVSVHQMAPPLTEVAESSCSLLLIYRPGQAERLSWPGSLTYSGWFYPHKWSPVSYKWSIGQGKFAGQRPTFYRCAMQPTNQLTGRLATYLCHMWRPPDAESVFVRWTISWGLAME